jgi:dTMP kinase
MRLRPGCLVVLEGLDATGKTTQRETLAAASWAEPRPLVTHMPSGLTDLTAAIYRTTEDHPILSPLARQLLHLACHAENLPTLRQARRDRGIILDRWWWSTVAYGWFGGLRKELAENAFFAAIGMVWDGFDADVVFCFLQTYEQDNHNLDTVVEGYRWLAAHHPDLAVEVPAGSQAETTAFLLEHLGAATTRRPPRVLNESSIGERAG